MGHFKLRFLLRQCFVLIIVTVLPSVLCAESSSSDDEFPPCQYGHSGFLNCMRNGIQKSISMLGNGKIVAHVAGSPGQTMPMIDPVLVERSEFTQQIMFSSINIVFHHAVLTGFKRAKVENVTCYSNANETNISFDALIPYLYLEADVNIEGYLLFLPFEDEGKIYIGIQDSYFHVNVSGSSVEKRGEIYFLLEQFNLNIKDSPLTQVHFESEEGNGFVREGVNELFNNFSSWFQDWMQLSTLRTQLENKFKTVTKKIFNNFPFSTFIV